MKINRNKAVSRHNPILTKITPESPLSVGNGELAFSVDPTGLQTFPEPYENGMPLCTQSQWGWHSFPDNDNLARDRRDLKGKSYHFHGRDLEYYTSAKGQDEYFHRLRQNPHRMNLARIGFDFAGLDPNAQPEKIRQELDLWTGIIESRFSIQNFPVRSRICCDPEKDTIAFTSSSPLFRESNGISFRFPYADPGMNGSDWHNGDKHSTRLIGRGSGYADFIRILDDTDYYIRISTGGRIYTDALADHTIRIESSDNSEEIQFTCTFSPLPMRDAPPGTDSVFEKSRRHWNGFWMEGGFIDLGDCTDPRAEELERRIILSQYLTAIQCSGSMPPQETGLTCNSWYGKFHLEMHYWNAAHFPLWNRPQLLENSLWWYLSRQNRAKELARSQGFAGVRWPKMVGPDGFDSPSPVGPLLIWQQPHPIMMAELIYRAKPSREFLETYGSMVFATADFMADYADYDKNRDQYNLGPGLIPAQENHKAADSINPPYELEYWSFGLKTAGLWRQRLGLPPVEKWMKIEKKLAKPVIRDGLYQAHENCPDTFTRFNYDHPSMLAAMGVLPGRRIDRDAMRRTLEEVRESWHFERMWGWDFPVMAMTAARLGCPDDAVDLLIMDAPKNTYLINGHNKQTGRSDLPLYMPGNGGLLTATAMMAAGWDEYKGRENPGFPDSRNWNVHWEGINPLP